MSRAYSIWLVARYEYDGVEPLAAFTVKREMIAWIEGQHHDALIGCGVIRMPDGGRGSTVAFEIEEMLSASK